MLRITNLTGFGGGQESYEIIISTTTLDFNLRNAVMALGWGGDTPCTVLCTVLAGAVVGSSGSGPGFTVGSFPDGSVITITNNHYIVGMGGRGGYGCDGGSCGSGQLTPPTDALSTTVPINLINNGTIGGGGAGGHGYSNCGGGGGAGHLPGMQGGNSGTWGASCSPQPGTLTTGGYGAEYGGTLGQSTGGGTAGRAIVGYSLINFITVGTILGSTTG